MLSVFEFRVPYYVGPLKENPHRNKKLNYWMVRKAQGKIYPWNFESKVDLDASEEAFIARMTNSCTYLPGENVLPKNSLIYCAFEVLNEINNIKINGNPISVEMKQSIYENVFMEYDKVTLNRIKDHLESNNYAKKGSYILSGLDVTVKSSLKPFRAFRNLLKNGLLSYSDAENIITRATYSEDKNRYLKWLSEHYPHLPESEIKYISRLKFKGFGRLSRKLLCGIEGAVDRSTGELQSIIRTMWETNFNFMELMSDRFYFADEIEKIVKDYYDQHPKNISERLEDMYVSNSTKRPIVRTLDIMRDVVKVQGHAPKMIFIEMARGSSEDQKGKRTNTRLQQILNLYEKVDKEEVRLLKQRLEDWGEMAHNKLQSDKLFLYFMQLGRCLYTNTPIHLDLLLAGDGTYNVEHIYPRSFVKDDSVINNKILVDSKANGEKGDTYPIQPAIQDKMRGYWTYLHNIGLISDEKFKRLIRVTHFTDEEKFEFINRQLVETRQSTKVIATLLKDIYPDTEIVYVKAGLVSDFRHAFELVKSRTVNDLHHAKDAYLNIVVGSVWHYKFSKRYYLENLDHNIKPEIVFTHTVKCGDKVIWNGAIDKNRVIQVVRKNTAHMTKYAFCRKGRFFDQMPLSASEGLTPRKKDMPTEIYGGYNKTTASFFVLVRYKIEKKQDVMLMAVELLYAKEFMTDHTFAEAYARKIIRDIVNKPISDVEFLLNKRIIKINTVLSLNGLRVCITGKSGGGRQIGVSIADTFKTSFENEQYIKRLESFANKKKKNENIVWNEEFDGIFAEKNLALYDYYIAKFYQKPYQYRPANPMDSLIKCRDRFISLSPDKQVAILLQIQGLFGRANNADLTAIGGVASAGSAKLSYSLSNWKKNYTDVRIIDQSASGLFEKISENLLDLL